MAQSKSDKGETLGAVLVGWLLLRALVPVLPIIIQYGFFLIGILEQPKFPQELFITSTFGLSLVVLAERQDLRSLMLFSAIPALLAGCLYSVAIYIQEILPKLISEAPHLVEVQQANYEKVLLAGFILWGGLLILNISSVALDWRKARKVPQSEGRA